LNILLIFWLSLPTHALQKGKGEGEKRGRKERRGTIKGTLLADPDSPTTARCYRENPGKRRGKGRGEKRREGRQKGGTGWGCHQILQLSTLQNTKPRERKRKKEGGGGEVGKYICWQPKHVATLEGRKSQGKGKKGERWIREELLALNR